MKIKLLRDYYRFKKGEIFEVSKEYATFIDKEKIPWSVNNTKGSIKAFEFIEEENQNKENGTIISLGYSNDLLKEELKSLQDQNETIKKENEGLNKLKAENQAYIASLQNNRNTLEKQVEILEKESNGLQIENDELLTNLNLKSIQVFDLQKLKTDNQDWIIKLRSEISCLKFSGETSLIKDLTKLIEVSTNAR